MKSLLSELAAQVFAGNEALGAIAVVLAVALLAIGSFLKVWTGWRVGGLVHSTKRQELYLKLLKKGVEGANAHKLEIAFMRAYGYLVPSFHIRFAATRENAERHLRSLRHGLMLVRREGETYVLKETPRRLRVRAVCGFLFSVGGAVAAVITFLGAVLGNVPGLALIGLELLLVFWLGADILRTNGCAEWLLDPANYPPSAPVKAQKPKKKPKDPRDSPTLERVA